MSKKLTPWFKASIKPVHPGWYECKYGFKSTAFWYWSGKVWKVGGFLNLYNAFVNEQKSPEQRREWRGLAEKP